MRHRKQARRPSERQLRRRAAVRERILRAAARLFAERGIAGVRLQEVADAADVARGTLYALFRCKAALVQAIVDPILDQAVHRSRPIAALEPRAAVHSLLSLYADLWRMDSAALRVAHGAAHMPLGRLADQHAVFLKRGRAALGKAARRGLLRSGDPRLALHLLSRLAVPALEITARHADGERLFIDSLKGLLLK